jgi:hypothetical protein
VAPESGKSVPMQPVDMETQPSLHSDELEEMDPANSTKGALGVLRPQSSFSGIKLGYVIQIALLRTCCYLFNALIFYECRSFKDHYFL